MTTFFIITTLIFLLTTLFALYSIGKEDEEAKGYIKLLEHLNTELCKELSETIEHKKSIIEDTNNIITEMNIKNHELQSQIEEQLRDIGL